MCGSGGMKNPNEINHSGSINKIFFFKKFYSTLSPQKLLSSANIQERIGFINDKYQHHLDKLLSIILLC